MKILKDILHILKIIIFGLFVIFALWFLGASAYEYGKYLLASPHVLANCAPCESFYINWAFVITAAACFIAIFVGLHPPKKIFFSFLAVFWLLPLLVMAEDAFSYALHPSNYRWPGDILIYANHIRSNWFFAAWSALGVFQLYLKPPVRKYVISVHLAVTLLNAFLGGALLS